MEPQKKVTWKDLRVGIFALCSFVLIFVAILMMGEGEFSLFKEKVLYRSFLPEANGLKAGSEVWLAGVEVGEVVSVHFANPNDIQAVASIEVVIEVEADIQDRIRKDSVLTLRTIGLLGDKYVEITTGTPDEPVIFAGGVIQGISLSTFDDLVGVGRSTARGFNEMLVELRRLAEDINNENGSVGKLIHDDVFYEKMNTTFDEAREMVQQARGGPGTVGKMMADVTLYNNLVTSTESTQKTIALLDSTIQSAGLLLSQYRNTEGTLGKLTASPELYEQIEDTVTRLDMLVRKVEQGEGTLGRLTQDETLTQEMEGLVIDMRSLIADFRANPNKYIKVSVF